MTDPRDARIAQLERELAEYQNETIDTQIEARLVRAHLKSTLDVAVRCLNRPPIAGALTGRRHDV